MNRINRPSVICKEYGELKRPRYLNFFFGVFLILFFGICNGQNLVSNPSFESYNSCPDFFSQINRSAGWYSARPTADYFNVCAPYYPQPYTCVYVPENTFGYRTPASGNAYAGVLGSVQDDEHREAIGGQLLQPLQIGTRYFVSFKVSAAGNVNDYQWCGINKIGALFSTTKYDSDSPSPICNNCAQVYSDSIITDTLNWTTIKGSFVADSAYSFINLGRFNLNALTTYIQITGTGRNAYYYFDDICVSADSAYAYNYVYPGEVVPVRLLNFNCNAKGITVLLEWTSAEEINLAKYIVEYSADGVYFTSIATINANGSNSKYNYIHQQFKSSAFYRLKVIDKDGSYSYSEVQFVKLNMNKGFTVLPNPAHEVIYIFTKNNQRIKAVQLLSGDGKLVKVFNQYNSGQEINIRDLIMNIYFLKIIYEDNTMEYGRFLKL